MINIRRPVFRGTIGRRRAISTARAASRSAQVAALRRRMDRTVPTRSLLGTEVKFFDEDNGDSATAIPIALAACTGLELNPDSNGLCMSVPSAGAGANQVEGSKMAIISIQIKGTINKAPQIDQTAAEANDNVFLALVMDTQTNGAFLNSEDVFRSGGIAANGINMIRNLSFRDRFRVLKSKTFQLSQTPISWDGTNIEQAGANVSFNWFVKFKKPVIVNFLATGSSAGDITDVRDVSIQLVGCATSANCTLTYNSRMRFIN